MTKTYVETFTAEVSRIREATWDGLLPLAARITEIDVAVSDYSLAQADAYDAAIVREGIAAKIEKRKPALPPINYKDATKLNQLADLILHEDLTDNHPDKMTRDEYPIMSETQLARRQSGRHKRGKGGMQGEVSMKGAWAVASDGRDYKVPLRRERSINENIYMDEHTTPWKRDEGGNVIVD